MKIYLNEKDYTMLDKCNVPMGRFKQRSPHIHPNINITRTNLILYAGLAWGILEENKEGEIVPIKNRYLPFEYVERLRKESEEMNKNHQKWFEDRVLGKFPKESTDMDAFFKLAERMAEEIKINLIKPYYDKRSKQFSDKAYL